MGDWTSWVVLAAGFFWFGFTFGYFFRKWLELRWIPNFQAEQEKQTDQEDNGE